jgi:6-phosphofructokinase 2
MGERRMILTLTMNPSLDKSAATKQVIPDRKVRCGVQLLEPGGGGINVARVTHRLGWPTLAVYPCGGTHGDTVVDLLEKEGVPQEPIRIEKAVRDSVMIMEESTGHQYRFSFPGPSLSTREQDRIRDLVAERVGGSSVLVLSGSVPPGVDAAFYRELVTDDLSGSCRVVVDSSGATLREALNGNVFLIKPNHREFEEIAGRSLPDDEAIAEAARRVIDETGVRYIAVSLGAGGVALAGGGRFVRIASPTVPIRSRVGAGDSAVGGIAFGLAHGLDAHASVQLGVAAGAATVMSPGTNLCRREDVRRLFEAVSGRQLPGRSAASDASAAPRSGAG